LSREAWEGLQVDQDKSVMSEYKKSTKATKILTWIVDIDHNREVDAYNTQKKVEGSQGESRELYETEYPEVKSTSKATFNYEDKGKIHNQSGRYGQEWKFDAALKEIDFE
jgi:hypothetical protein